MMNHGTVPQPTPRLTSEQVAARREQRIASAKATISRDEVVSKLAAIDAKLDAILLAVQETKGQSNVVGDNS